MSRGLSHFCTRKSQADKFKFPLKRSKTAGLKFSKNSSKNNAIFILKSWQANVDESVFKNLDNTKYKWSPKADFERGEFAADKEPSLWSLTVEE